MTMFITVATAMEQFQQIEVVNGLSASLTARPTLPACSISSPSARPSRSCAKSARPTTATASARAHAGPGRPDRPERNLRLSAQRAVRQRETATSISSHQRRALGDIGIDIRPWEHGVLELNYSDYTLVDKGYPGWFTYGEKIQPAAGAGSARASATDRHMPAWICARASPRARIKQELESELASGRRHPQSGRLAQHQHAGQQPDIERGQLCFLVRERLRATLRHHQRYCVSQRQFRDLGHAATI